VSSHNEIMVRSIIASMKYTTETGNINYTVLSSKQNSHHLNAYSNEYDFVKNTYSLHYTDFCREKHCYPSRIKISSQDYQK
jgi:hypothetical protein